MSILNYHTKFKKEGRNIVLPDKPAIYLSCFGNEKLYLIGTHAIKFCTGCRDYKNLSHFKPKNKGLYLSVLCKRCLQHDIKDKYEYHISLAKVCRNITNKLRYITKNKSIEYTDIPDDLIEMERKKITLKTKIKCQNQQQNQTL